MKRPLTAVAVLVLVTSVASPAAAQNRSDQTAGESMAWDRQALEPDVHFTELNGVLREGIRCGTRPLTANERAASDAAVEAVLAIADPSFRLKKVVIPVAFHVVRKRNGKYDVPDEQIDAQIALLNSAFRNRGFAFTLQQVIRHDNNRFARRCQSRGVEMSFKRKNAVDPATTLNVYTCRPSNGVLGYAWFPSNWPEDHFMHGVVALYSSLPGGTAYPYDEGDTIVHEVGHYLGLFHTFEGGCSGTGDRVGDTPAQSSPTFGCPVRRDSCINVPGKDPIHNFMDYSDDVCMTDFTKGQKSRMQDQVRTFRGTLVQ